MSSDLQERLAEERVLRARIRDLERDVDELEHQLERAGEPCPECEHWRESYTALAELVRDVDRGIVTFPELLQTVRP